MNSAQLLQEGFGRIQDLVHGAVDGLTADQLTYRVDPDTNTIAWLIWHLTRIQDDHIAEAAGLDQVWTAQGWTKRFGLPLDDVDTGYGHSRDDVAAVCVETPDLLTGYYDEVWDQTRAYLDGLDDEALDRIVDERWDPPVTLGVRLTSVIGDDLQHVGQAALLRGIVTRH